MGSDQSPNVTPSPSPTPSQSSTPTPTPPPFYCASGGAQLWSNLETCGWPGPANTGPDLSQCPGGTLKNVGSSANTKAMVITTPNTIISCMNITGGVEVAALNVTIQNSIITYAAGGAGGTADIEIDDGASATIDHVELNGLDDTHACIFDVGVKSSSLAYSMVAKSLNCHDVNDGIFSWWWPQNQFAGAGSDFIIQDSYFHDFTEDAANGHIDGYQTQGAQNGTITHNTYQMVRTPDDKDVSGGAMDSAIAVWADYNESSPTGLTAGNFLVSNNLFGIQGSYTVIYAEDESPGDGGPGDPSAVGGNQLIKMNFFNNSFSTYWSGNNCVSDAMVWFYRASWAPYYGGPTDLWNQGGSTRSGNQVLETGFNLDNGNPPGCL